MPKEKYTIEYNMKQASAMLLWNQIATPTGLAQWFADKVKLNGKNLTFTWNKIDSEATIVSSRVGLFIRFKWIDDNPDDKTFFEMKINISELTEITTLIITDFSEPEEIESAIELWDYQIESLKRNIGCL